MFKNENNAKGDGKARGKSVLLRHEKIVELVKSRGFASIESLAKNFGVTPQTIRRDINELTEIEASSRFFQDNAGLHVRAYFLRFRSIADEEAGHARSADGAHHQQINLFLSNHLGYYRARPTLNEVNPWLQIQR